VTIPLKRTIVYGPVASRRLGRSLGVNLLPRGMTKLCSFDCQYCQYGWSDFAHLRRIDELGLPRIDEVGRAVAGALESLSPPPDFVTFSGNGEPTLHPAFPAMVEEVRSVRDRLAPTARLAILSNSSRLGNEDVRRALARLDARIMKLDAGNESTFQRFNRPAPGITLAPIVEALGALPEVTLQSLFADGPGGNLEEPDVSDWLDCVARIRPIAVQVYTLARGYPSSEIGPAPAEALDRVREKLSARGLKVQSPPRN
jgi:wyosine [tRNA(Phe)-imidazoG37] synthetase (radical SAM superfamily)